MSATVSKTDHPTLVVVSDNGCVCFLGKPRTDAQHSRFQEVLARVEAALEIPITCPKGDSRWQTTSTD